MLVNNSLPFRVGLGDDETGCRSLSYSDQASGNGVYDASKAGTISAEAQAIPQPAHERLEQWRMSPKVHDQMIKRKIVGLPYATLTFPELKLSGPVFTLPKSFTDRFPLVPN